MRQLILIGLLLSLTCGNAAAQTRVYVIHGSSGNPNATTFTPANPPSDASPSNRVSSDPVPTYYQPQPGRAYDQIYYGDAAYMAAYRRVIRMYNPSIDSGELDTIVRSILYYGYQFKVDPRFVVAVVAHESRFQTHAVSPAGAQGLGQLMPGTAASLGVDPHVAYQNVQGTVRYLKLMLERFKHLDRTTQMRLALASYNAGYGAVTKYGGIPPYAETQRYVEVIMAEYRKLSGER